MMLHTLNSSPSDRTTFQSCAASLSEGDSLLLIEELSTGCYRITGMS